MRTKITVAAAALVAAAGQRATVTFQDISGKGTWSLVAPDGSPLHNGMSEEQGHATLTLPQTGSYRLDLQIPSGATYTVTLSIPRA